MYDYFGERALLFDEDRSATVIAKSEVTCWVLSKADFMNVVEEDILKQLLKRIDLQDDSVEFSDLIIVKTLGRGMFGNVFLCKHIEKNILYALKVIHRKKIAAFQLQQSLMLEKRILMQLDHSFIVKLVKTFKDDDRVYFLLEFVYGMDLFDVIRKMGLLNDQSTKFYIASLLLILEHLHERDVIYRDLKPENVMVDDEGYLRLIDFGTAAIVHGRAFTILGTPHYMAPEIISGKGYNYTVDYWSLGVMIYEFLFGYFPFGNDVDDPYQIYESIVGENVMYPSSFDQGNPVTELIELLLSKNPAMRTGGSIRKIKSLSWFHNF